MSRTSRKWLYFTWYLGIILRYLLLWMSDVNQLFFYSDCSCSFHEILPPPPWVFPKMVLITCFIYLIWQKERNFSYSELPFDINLGPFLDMSIFLRELVWINPFIKWRACLGDLSFCFGHLHGIVDFSLGVSATASF